MTQKMINEIELYCNTCKKVVCHNCPHEHKRTYWRFKRFPHHKTAKINDGE